MFCVYYKCFATKFKVVTIILPGIHFKYNSTTSSGVAFITGSVYIVVNIYLYIGEIEEVLDNMNVKCLQKYTQRAFARYDELYFTSCCKGHTTKFMK